jgi:peptidoglycan/LPS O-acetylase OafA/YrhL
VKENNYYYSLDLFRGFCGYGVAICHLNAFAYGSEFMEYLSLVFVEFFFVLSGFVLYPQLLKVIDKKSNLFIFYKRRWIRTLPLYFITLILISILTNHMFDVNFFKYLFLIQKFLPNFIDNDYFPVAWSLSIEELFYLLFPLILIFLNQKNFLKISIFIFILIAVFKYFISGNFDANFYRTGSFLRFDAILFGFLISHFKIEILKYKKSIIFFTIIAILTFLFCYEFFTINNNDKNNRFVFILFMQLISAFTLFSFLLLEPLLKYSNMPKKISLIISQQTYSIYLFHLILIYIFNSIKLSIYIAVPVYILLLFLISNLIYNFFEKPLLKLRPRIS